MRSEDLEGLLQDLCRLPGPSGDEEPVLDHLSLVLSRIGCSTSYDGFGNLLALAEPGEAGAGGKLLIAAHADEKGLMVSRIGADGLISFDHGSLDRRCLPAQEVSILTRRGPVAGLIQAGLHFRDGSRDTPAPSEMRIDVGAATQAEAEEDLDIRVGDPIVFSGPFVHLHGETVMSRALDNRAGLAAAVAALARAGKDVGGPVVLAATRQEETGLRGAGPAAVRARPAAALAVDVISGQVYGHDEATSRSMLGRGVVIHHDSGTDRAMRDHVLEVARLRGIAHQCQAMIGVGADARPIGQALDGIRVVSLLIPTLHFHTPRALMSMSDLRAAADLLEALVTDEEFFRLFS